MLESKKRDMTVYKLWRIRPDSFEHFHSFIVVNRGLFRVQFEHECSLFVLSNLF